MTTKFQNLVSILLPLGPFTLVSIVKGLIASKLEEIETPNRGKLLRSICFMLEPFST